MSEPTAGIRGDLKKDGYSQEELYFYRINRELIERRRRELDPKRQSHSATQESESHWLACPKCGQRMVPVNLLGIQVEQCSKCQGVYFDRAEVETLVEAQEHKHFISALWKLLRGAFAKADPKWTP